MTGAERGLSSTCFPCLLTPGLWGVLIYSHYRGYRCTHLFRVCTIKNKGVATKILAFFKKNSVFVMQSSPDVKVH